MLEDKVIANGAFSTMVQLTSKYVIDLRIFALAINKSKEYVIQAQSRNDIAACLKLHYDLKTLSKPAAYHKKVDLHLTKVVECFFLRISNVRSGQKERKTTTFREMPMRVKDVLIQWHASFPECCREAAKTWPSWYKMIFASKHSSKRNKFEASVIASVECTPAFAGEEFSARRREATISYHNLLRKNRDRASGGICVSLEVVQANIERRQRKEQEEFEELRRLDECMDINDTQAAKEVGIVGPGKHEINVPSIKFLFKVVKDLGYSWSSNVYPTECPIHDTGPGVKLRLGEANKALAIQGAKYESAEKALGNALQENAENLNEFHEREKRERLRFAELQTEA
jgi:hypothetical protein